MLRSFSYAAAGSGILRGAPPPEEWEDRARATFMDGYFETVAGPRFLSSIQRQIDAVTPEQIWDVARRRLTPANRTVGWFRPTGRS